MLVSHRFQFIYTKTVKTAGTSIESYFERFCMAENQWNQSHAREEYDTEFGIVGRRGANADQANWWNHMPARTIARQLGEAKWNRYFKFCVVRNPFDKCISAFEHFGRNHKVVDTESFDPGNQLEMNAEQTRFCDYLRHHCPVDRDKYILNNQFCLDDVIRFESMDHDLQRICQKLELPYELEFLPKFKTGCRRPKATFENLYTPQSRAIVEDKFAFELDYFGYRFPVASAA